MDTNPAWDQSQLAALDAVTHGGNVAVVGAPGSGKTTLAVEAIARAVEQGSDQPGSVLLLAPDRRSATALRDRLTVRLGRTLRGTMVRSVASLAYAIVAQQCRLDGDPLPELATGPEQDADLAALLAGHAAGEGVRVAWPEGITPEVLALAGFRAELRDLLMRCAERGVGPVELGRLGRSERRPEWVAAASLYSEYLDVTTISRQTPDVGPRYDAATLVDVAAETVRRWVAAAEPGRPQWTLVVVDDYQDATAATARLLRELTQDGARVVLLGDPDQAVQGFRGARPDLLGRAMAQPAPHGRVFDGEFSAEQIVLRSTWRQADAVREVVGRVVQHIGSSAGVAHREALREAAGQRLAGSVERCQAGSVVEEHAVVARLLRTEHLLDRTPWSQMAVIARTSGQVTALRRALAAAAVPVSGMGADQPLRSEPAVRALLMVIGRASDELWDEPVVAELLSSPYGGLDALRMRRLRRALLRQERMSGGRRSSDDLLVEAVTDPAGGVEPHAPGSAAVRRIRAMIAAARAAVQAGSDAHLTLWAVWDAAQVAEEWQERAWGSGSAAQRADADLDAVMAAFREAEVYTERHIAASVGQFVEWLLGLRIPADSLAARARPGGAVEVITPAQAAGREWDLVVVSGVQDGTWPDLRLRDSLLGAQALADLVDGRGSGNDPRAARHAVLDDELRLLAVATSRARRRLVVTAVQDADSQPSVFCSLIAPETGADGDSGLAGSLPRVPLDLRGVVITARAGLARAITAQREESSSWSGLLADLAQVGVRQADPRWWYSVAAPSSMGPLADHDSSVAVSPSKVTQVHTCALRWVVEAADGSGQEQVAAGLGTLIHAIARDLPSADSVELSAELDRRWPELGLPPGWPAMQLRHQAEGMVRRLGDFQSGAGEPVAVEQGFDIPVGRARLRGSIDRVDRTAAGLRVTDYKTGKTPLTAAEAEVDPQLASYQVALSRDDGADDPDGAELVYLGVGMRGPGTRQQPALADFEHPGWAEEMVEEAAQIMAAAQFWATVNPGCLHCPVRRACPVQPEGQMVAPVRGATGDEGCRAPRSSFSTVEDRARRAHGLSTQGADPSSGMDAGPTTGRGATR